MNFVRHLPARESDACEQPGVAEQEPSRMAASGRRVAHHQSSQHDIQIGLATDPGRVRDHNEDTSLAWQLTMTQPGQHPMPTGIFVIADGMGGQAQGEEASVLATHLASAHVIQRIALPMLSDDADAANREPIHDILSQSMRIAHQAVARRYPRAGTTLTMALVLGENLFIAHVGDSRAYLGQRGSLEPLTRDHSVAARLVEMGQATEEEAMSQRNILYKAIGQGPEVEPDIVYHDLSWGQYLLLCCDGLWGEVPDAQIAAIVEAAPTPDAACQALVAQANDNGGEDNISVILVARGWPLPASNDLGPILPQIDHGI
jgi:serine/threonine protein phosphatase PrpC